MTHGMKIGISVQTDIGRERTHNEDACAFCSDLRRGVWNEASDAWMEPGEMGAVLIVADGMGGANAGEVASSIAIEAIRKRYARNAFRPCRTKSEACGFLKEAVREADEAIRAYCTVNVDAIGMGTTVVIAWILDGCVHIAWAGDSRCYVFNPVSGLKRLTADHSYVQELVQKGELTEEEAFGHPDGSVITRCLGDTDSPAEPDIVTYVPQPNDLLLLCSDGLCGYCRDRKIERKLFRTFEQPRSCCGALVDMALAAGGCDNITVALASFVPSSASAPAVPWTVRVKRALGMYGRRR